MVAIVISGALLHQLYLHKREQLLLAQIDISNEKTTTSKSKKLQFPYTSVITDSKALS